jgi:putative zinc finger/helix-turn-helix YgiT family protein
MLTRCPNCQAAKLKDRLVEEVKTVGDHRFRALVPGQECQACGEGFFETRTLARFDQLVAKEFAEAGVTSGEALRFIRKAAGVPAADFAALLDVRPETVSRWEHDKRPIDRGSYAVLHQLLLDKLAESTATADYLRGLGKAKRLPKTVEVEVEAA